MTPQAKDEITQAINSINKKVLYETKLKGFNKGFDEGFNEGFDEGEMKTKKNIAKKLKKNHTDEEISNITGLNIEEIKKI